MTTITEMQLTIGIIGAGGFAGFAANAFSKVPGISIAAVFDIDQTKAIRLAEELNAVVHSDLQMFLSDTRIALVYIATPPFLHYQQSKMALLAGKHVICEKPAALKLCEAEELERLAESLQLLYVVNLMQRYNRLYDVVKKIVKGKYFGNFLHGYFENYASDENLDSEHWFWDESKSGGIFIEHGVHFFDMFEGWLGEGIVVNALQLQRRGVEKKIIDRVQATILYNNGIVNFYHGFDQPKILDRQELRLQFERGEITLFGWVPVKIQLHGLFQEQQVENLRTLIGDFKIIRHSEHQEGQKVRGRFCDVIFDDHVTIEFGNISDKQNHYQQMLEDMIIDQWQWIKDHKHICVIDSSNAIQSLKIAEEATHKAQNY